jgi:hypothetical protein
MGETMKPSDFFFGAMEFFAVLLPGVILAYLLLPWAPAVLGPVLPSLRGDWQPVVAFAVLGYAFGHGLHGMGSLLDSRHDRYYAQPRRHLGEEPLLKEVRRRVEQVYGALARSQSMHHWADAYVRTHSVAASAELERAGADAKFFRSFAAPRRTGRAAAGVAVAAVAGAAGARRRRAVVPALLLAALEGLTANRRVLRPVAPAGARGHFAHRLSAAAVARVRHQPGACQRMDAAQRHGPGGTEAEDALVATSSRSWDPY